MLEQLVDPKDDSIDFLVWEHSINDHAPTTEGEPHEMLQFWLTRVQNLYGRVNKPPPPILILSLWKFNVGLESDESILQQGIGPEIQKSLQVIDEYITKGFEIQVLDVTKLISRATFIASSPLYTWLRPKGFRIS